MKLLPRRLLFIGLLALAFAVLLFPMRGQANATTPETPSHAALTADWVAAGTVETIRGADPSVLPPPPEQDPCLHCHIEGQIENDWSPISRWLVFGTMWFAFIFGISRNFIVWRTREIWHPRWMERFSLLTAIVFVLQVLTGIIALALAKATPEIIVQITAVTKAIHWGSAIVLFIAALGLSFAGISLPGFQRPFWGLVFLTGLISGTLGLANLSFVYLYGEWHDPPASIAI